MVDVPGSRPIVVSLGWDIVLNATVPVACYFFAKRLVSPSELTALLFATAFPLLKGGYDLTQNSTGVCSECGTPVPPPPRGTGGLSGPQAGA